MRISALLVATTIVAALLTAGPFATDARAQSCTTSWVPGGVAGTDGVANATV